VAAVPIASQPKNNNNNNIGEKLFMQDNSDRREKKTNKE
jgi:hypothetical protein